MNGKLGRDHNSANVEQDALWAGRITTCKKLQSDAAYSKLKTMVHEGICPAMDYNGS